MQLFYRVRSSMFTLFFLLSLVKQLFAQTFLSLFGCFDDKVFRVAIVIDKVEI